MAPAQQRGWGWAPEAKPLPTAWDLPAPTARLQLSCPHISCRNRQAQARRQVTCWDGRLPSFLLFHFFFN